MLSYQLLKNHAGIMLIGDYTSLRWLHEVVHDINERSPLVEDKEGWFLGLAYDVRKAYEQNRETIPPPKGFEEIGTRYGVQILWPVLLLQQRVMRASLAYLDNSRKQQAITYALEAVIEEALRKDFTQQGEVFVDQWQTIDPTHRSVFDKLDSRGAIFCSWTKAERNKYFLSLITSFHSMYEQSYTYRIRNGEKGLVAPEAFVQWSNVEWPDPRW